METPIQTFYDGPLFDPLGTRAGLEPLPGIPPFGLPSASEDVAWLDRIEWPLRFELDPARSFFGDCINVVDAPDEKTLDAQLPPFGWSAASLTDGLAMTFSSLAGSVEVTASAARDGFIDLVLRHGGELRGVDGTLSTPSGYGIAVHDNRVRDVALESHARLDIATGRLYDLHYNVAFDNSAIRLLCALNPGLVPPPLLFPGLPHAGHTMGWIAVGANGRRLSLHVIAQQFLPLGPSVEGRALRMPASQTGFGQQEAFAAANSSLHPFIAFVAEAEIPESARAAAATASRPPAEHYRQPGIAPALPRTRSLADYANSVETLKCLPGSTDFGDDFALQSPDLGGCALARSPLFGSVRLQFGPVVEGKLAFALSLVAPTPALHSKTEQFLKLLPPGTEPGLVGMHGELHFPQRSYPQHELSLTTDPYKVSVGVIDLASGRFEDMVLRKYLFQNVMRNLLLVEPRTPTDSFCYICDGQVDATAVGLMLRLYGDFTIPYPAGYAFPLPGGNRKTRIGSGSHLLPFVNIEAVSAEAFSPGSRPFAFRGAHHVRGALKAATTLVVGTGPDGPHARLHIGAAAIEAQVTTLSNATIGDLEIIEIELAARPTGARKPENVYAMLLLRDGAAQLLMVSECETFDGWIEGSLDWLPE